jgi:hypothetical protein
MKREDDLSYYSRLSDCYEYDSSLLEGSFKARKELQDIN